MNVSLAGNPNAVLVSPTWKIESAILTVLLNVAAVPVIILSVDATPVNPDPSPENEVAETVAALRVPAKVETPVTFRVVVVEPAP